MFVVGQVVDVPHTPPVDAPIADPFRRPDGPYAPGNRGLEYDTHFGQLVQASSTGVVTFSGQVGGHMFVTIRHSADLRTTVGFVETVLVHSGDVVLQGQVIATAGNTIHFTARRNGGYIDPELLFQRFETVVRLVSEPG
jgi:murein DD-endopeptidase MepM/ murein hydrolase activator NlpD